MRRILAYSQQVPSTSDILSTNKNVLMAIGYFAQDVFGSAICVSGLPCSPTVPGALSVQIGLGRMYSPSVVDATAYSDLGIDTTDNIIKQGILLAPVTLNTPAPVTVGQSIAYLVEAQYQDADVGSTVLPYYNVANPLAPLSGVGGLGVAQPTQRDGIISLQVKAGIAATTGTQVTPTPDTGYTGLWVITIAYGATTVVSGNIAQYPGAPFLTFNALTALTQANADLRYLPLYLRTPAEIAAGVVPTNYSYGVQPYDIRRYGAAGDGVADDTAALKTALLVATQTVNTALGSAIFVPIGTFLLSSMVALPNRVRVLGLNKRGSYFKAAAGWAVGNGVGAYSAGTTYGATSGTALVLVTSGGILYSSRQAGNIGNTPASSPTFWTPISNAMFYAQNGYAAGAGNSMFDSTLENITVDANNVAGLGCVLSSAWQEDCGLRGVLLIGCATYGVRYQDAFGGASLSKVVDTEIFGTTGLGIDLTSPMGAVGAFMLDVSNTSITGGALTAGISSNGNSILCRSVHFETTGIGVQVDGTGWASFDDLTGNATVTSLVTIAATFTGTLMMKNCRRTGSTNFLNDLRAGGLGTMTGFDTPLVIQGSTIPPVMAGGIWSCGKFTVAGGVVTVASSFNVTSVVRSSAGVFVVTEARSHGAVGASSCSANSAQITSGFTCGAQAAGAASYTIQTAVAGVLTDPSSEVNFQNVRTQ